MSNYREATIAVSNAVRWKLTRIVKARNQSEGNELTVPANVDAFADDVLAEFISTNYPELDKLWSQREAIDKQAEESAKPKEPVAVPF